MKRMTRLKNSIATLLSVFVGLFILNANPAHAQTGMPHSLNVFAGFALPIGDYSSTSVTSADNFLSASGNTPGFAQLGFTGGMEYSIRLYEMYEIGLLGNVSINSTDEGALRKISSDISTNTSGGTWILIGGLVSAGISHDVAPGIGLHGRVYMGLMGGNSAEFSFYNLNASGNYITQKTTWSSALGYGLGAGITFSNEWDCNVRFITSNPEYSTQVTDGRQITAKVFKQQSNLVMLTIGLVIK